MSAALVATLSLAVEVALLLALIFVAARLLDTRARILLQRCAFIAAAAAPLTLLIPAPEAALVAVPIEPGAAIAQFQESAKPSATAPALPAALALIWLAGFLFVLGRAVVSQAALSRFFARARTPGCDLAALIETVRHRIAPSARVQVRISDAVRAPCTFGAARCKILLPPKLPNAAMPAVLAHELCHVRAGDAFWLSFGQIVCALYWFNPLAWLIASEHRNDIESACDDDVVSGGVDLDDYVRALVSAAAEIGRPARAGAIAMSRRGLSTRVRALLHRSSPMPLPSGTQRAALVGAVAALATLLAAGDLVSAREFRTVQPGEGQGLIYVRADRGVEVRIGTIAMCGNDADCVFELPLGQEITLEATASRSGDVRWSGCTPSACVTQISEEPVRVSARLR